MSDSKKKSNFLVQGSILAVASIISRIIGLLYRLPMTDIIGDLGNDYYSAAFELYSVMLMISSYSLPLAVSKLVSVSMAKGQRKMTYKILKGALLFAAVSGTIVAIVVYFGAEFFTTVLLKTPFSIFALKVLAPALVVVAILGVIRGFFQGLGTMMPSAVSQIIEQVINAIVSVWAAFMLVRTGAKVGAVLGAEEEYKAAYGAAGGTLGTNLGSVAALLFVLFVLVVYMTVFKRQMKRDRRRNVKSFGSIMQMLILTIIPVLLSTTIYNISGIIDQGLYKNIAALQGYDSKETSILWGVFAGKYKLMINVPISIASAMAASAVPTLTASFSSGDMDGVKNQINAAMRFVMVIAFPCAVGLAVLAYPIFAILFPSTIESIDDSTRMMWLGAVAVVFYSMSTLSNGLLQGINRMKAPVKNAAIALVAHVLILIVLMMFFRLHIYSVVIANTLFALFMCILNARDLYRYSGYRQEVVKTFLIPVLCSLIMGAAAFGVYEGLFKLTKLMPVAFVFAFVIAVIVYAVSMLLLKGLEEEDIIKFPKGASLVRLFKKLNLLK